MENTSVGGQHAQPQTQLIPLSSKRIGIDLELMAVLLALVSLAGQMLKYLTNYDKAFGLIPLVYMGKSLSIPTIFTVLLYSVLVLLLGVISSIGFQRNDRFRWRWLGLAFIFLYLSLDKGTGLHTYLIKPVRNLIRDSLPGIPVTQWMLTLCLVILLVLCFYPKFIAALPRKTKIWALISLAIYYCGFLVLQRFAVDYLASIGEEDLVYSILITFGKVLEMSGLVAGIYTLFNFLQNKYDSIFLQIRVSFKKNTQFKN